MAPEPSAVRERLLAAGARPGFAGVMIDVRWDRNGELTAGDEVLRLRTFCGAGGSERCVLGWKGPTGVSPEGFKERRELEYSVSSDRAPPQALLEALGYAPIHTIERYVEYYHLGSADARLEWYPRMDTLIEIEGEVESIEVAVRATGLPRDTFTADSLTIFAARFASRSGAAAAMTRAELGPTAPTWPPR